MIRRTLGLVAITIASGILFMMAPATFAAPHPIDTKMGIDEFGEM